ncbi:uncharacterized protein LOC117899084 [Drosophila subobscura]|uniref:uncharacterized protein LOC117899084 n=1 Tax=Drosophila subobscura TaxID=7241 RepID=UPI00155AD1D5|nr:uncharacterized protein LOC117899084 [Drosophila subobscura]
MVEDNEDNALSQLALPEAEAEAEGAASAIVEPLLALLRGDILNQTQTRAPASFYSSYNISEDVYFYFNGLKWECVHHDSGPAQPHHHQQQQYDPRAGSVRVPGGAAQRSRGSVGLPLSVLVRHRLRQFPGHPGRHPGALSAHGHQLLHHQPGRGGLPGGTGCDALLGTVRGAGEHLVLWHRLVRHLALPGRSLQHRLDPQSVRHIAGPLLGHHRSLQLSHADDGEAGRRPDSRRLDLLECHQLPGHRLVAGGAGRRDARLQVHLHRAPGLLGVLLDDLLLPAAAGDGVHLLPDLPGGGDSDALPQDRHQAGADGLRGAAAHAAHPSWWHHQGSGQPGVGWGRRRRRRRWRRIAQPLPFAFAPSSPQPWRRHDHIHARGARRRAAIGAAQQRTGPPPAHGQELLALPEAGQVRQGEEGGQDAGHCDGRVHRVLAAVLCGQPAVRVLHGVHRARGDCLSDCHLAGLDQLVHESRHLCLLEQGLSQSLCASAVHVLSPQDPPEVSAHNAVQVAVPRGRCNGGSLDLLWLPLGEPAGPHAHVTSAEQLQHLQRWQQLRRRWQQRRRSWRRLPQRTSPPSLLGHGHALLLAAFVHPLPELPSPPPPGQAPQLRDEASRGLQLHVGGEQCGQDDSDDHSTAGGSGLCQLVAPGRRCEALIGLHSDHSLGAGHAAAGAGPRTRRRIGECCQQSSGTQPEALQPGDDAERHGTVELIGSPRILHAHGGHEASAQLQLLAELAHGPSPWWCRHHLGYLAH